MSTRIRKKLFRSGPAAGGCFFKCLRKYQAVMNHFFFQAGKGSGHLPKEKIALFQLFFHCISDQKAGRKDTDAADEFQNNLQIHDLPPVKQTFATCFAGDRILRNSGIL